MSVRPPAVAGSFYPASAVELGRTVAALLAGAHAPTDTRRPVAVVAPHAGLVYSGPVAATAYAQVRPHVTGVHRVLLLGPAHHVALDGLAVPTVSAWATPLGEHALDEATCRTLADLPFVVASDDPHREEHSLEVQVPFLHRLLPDVPLTPVVVGPATPTEVADALDLVVDDGTLVVVSTDLSHYLPHEEAVVRDRRTAEAVERLDVEGVGPHDACGRYPLRGLMRWADRRGLSIRLLDLRTSGDTAGDRRRVVGYGAFRVDPA